MRVIWNQVIKNLGLAPNLGNPPYPLRWDGQPLRQDNFNMSQRNVRTIYLPSHISSFVWSGEFVEEQCVSFSFQSLLPAVPYISGLSIVILVSSIMRTAVWSAYICATSYYEIHWAVAGVLDNVVR